VRVLGVDDGRPTRIAVRFDASAEDASLALLAWDGTRLRRVTMPAVGQSIVLPWSPGPMRSF
jgi:hypothetical protein